MRLHIHLVEHMNTMHEIISFNAEQSICSLHFQAKAPRSTVVVVGTHLDMIPRAERERKCRIWRDKLEKYSFSRQHSKAFPRILGLHFTGCPQRGKTIEVETLNDMLYDVAMDMDAPRGTYL